MAMTERDFEAWARLRRMGGFRFVLGIGVLGFGVPFAVLFFLFFAAAVWLLDGVCLPPDWFAFISVLSLLAGLVFGLWQWFTSERAFRRWQLSGSRRELLPGHSDKEGSSNSSRDQGHSDGKAEKGNPVSVAARRMPSA